MKTKRPIKYLLLSLLSLSIFSFALNNKIEAKAESAVDYENWQTQISGFLTTKKYQENGNNRDNCDEGETVNYDDPRGTVYKFQVLPGDLKCFYATPGGIDGGNTGYLNDHRSALTDASGNSFLSYVFINDRSALDIIVDNQEGRTNYTSPLHWLFEIGGQYSPLQVELKGTYLHFTLLGDYLYDQGLTVNSVRLSLKEGCPLKDASGNSYTLPKTISSLVQCKGMNTTERFSEVNESADLNYIRDTVSGGVAWGLRAAQVWFSKPLTNYKGNWMLDNYMALTAYITINGKSIQQWNMEIDDSSWDYSTCAVGDNTSSISMYSRPIRMFVDSNNPCATAITFHPNFEAQFKDGEVITLGIKRGLSYTSDSTKNYQGYDVENAFIYNKNGDYLFTPVKANANFAYGDFSKQATSVTTTSTSLEKTDNANFVTITLNINKSINAVSSFDIVDGNDSRGLNYDFSTKVSINGTSVNAINKTTNKTGYSWNKFPTDVSETYQNPVNIVISEPTKIQLLINIKYIQSLTGNMTIAIEEGAKIYNATSCTDATNPHKVFGVFEFASFSATVERSIVTHADYKASTCDAQGNLEYYYDEITGKYYKDSALTQEYSEGEWLLPAAHTLEKHNANAKTCTTAGNIEYWECTQCHKLFDSEDCSHEISAQYTVIPASHELVKHEKVNAQCGQNGCKEYWECSVCHECFEDANATTKIDDLDAWKEGAGKIAATEHEYENIVWGEWTINGQEGAIQASFKCKNCEHTEVVDAEVTCKVVVYSNSPYCADYKFTATVTFAGKTYKAYKTVEINEGSDSVSAGENDSSGSSSAGEEVQRGCKGSVATLSLLLCSLSAFGIVIVSKKKRD